MVIIQILSIIKVKYQNLYILHSVKSKKLATATFCQLLVFRATFFVSSNFSNSWQFLAFYQFSDNLRSLNWPCFHISQCFSRQFINFLWKWSQFLPRGSRTARSMIHTRLIRVSQVKKDIQILIDSTLTKAAISGDRKKTVFGLNWGQNLSKVSFEQLLTFLSIFWATFLSKYKKLLGNLLKLVEALIKFSILCIR